MRHYVLVHLTPPSTKSSRCPDQDPGGDPLGHHSLTHQELPQMLSVHTGMRGAYTLLNHELLFKKSGL